MLATCICLNGSLLVHLVEYICMSARLSVQYTISVVESRSRRRLPLFPWFFDRAGV